MIAERRELASLKTTERTTLLSVQVGAIGVEPVNRLRSNLIPINVVGERETAMRNEVWKNEGSGHLSWCVHVWCKKRVEGGEASAWSQFCCTARMAWWEVGNGMRRFAGSFKLGAVPFGDRLCCVSPGSKRIDWVFRESGRIARADVDIGIVFIFLNLGGEYGMGPLALTL